MEPISLILTALATAIATGVTKGATDTVNSAIKDTYEALRTRLKQKFADMPKQKAILDDYIEDPETWRKPLEKALTNVQANQDTEIIMLSKRILEQAQVQEHASGIKQSAIGDRNIQIGGSFMGGSASTGDGSTKPIGTSS